MNFHAGPLSVPDAQRLNEMWRELERLRRLTVGAPLQISHGMGGDVISAPGLGGLLGGLTIEDADGAPEYAKVTTIQFDQADGFTLSETVPGTVRVDFTFSGVTGTGTDNRIARFDGTGTPVIQDSAWKIVDNGRLSLVADAVPFPAFETSRGFEICNAAVGGLSVDPLNGLGMGIFLVRNGATATDVDTVQHSYRVGTVSGYKVMGFSVQVNGFFFNGDVGSTVDTNRGFSIGGVAGGSVVTGGLTFSGGLYMSGTSTAYAPGGTDVAVADGGTGGGSFTAYAVICAGTTSTGPFQNVSGVGTAGQVLTSNGAAALPTWQAGGGVSDGDKGDITVSSSGAAWAIDNDAVTYAKMQNVSAASKLLGRGDSGAGDPQELTLGTGLSMSGTTLNAAAAVADADYGDITVSSSGTVWEIDANAVGTTEIATAAVTMAKLADIASNRVIGRNTGGTGVPSALTASDVLSMIATGTGTLLVYGASAWGGLGASGVAKDYLTQTVAGVPSWGALVPFVAAGASHAVGGVPDPGATAHTNQPYNLGSNGTWNKNVGVLLRESHEVASEATSSTTNTDLTTVQSVSLTLDDACDLIVHLSATCSHSAINGAARLVVDLDGTDTDGPTIRCPAATLLYPCAGSVKLTGVSAAPHTIKMQFRTNTGTVTFENRGMTITRST
jgi:hypothetical protein